MIFGRDGLNIALDSGTKTDGSMSTNQELVTIYTALGIAHLIIVVVPSLILASIVLYFLFRLMKTSGVKPVTLLFTFLAILCMLGPLSYGIIWDISLITDLPLFGNCSSPQPVHTVQYLLSFGFITAVSVTIAMIAVLQFMVLQCSMLIKLQHVIIVYAVALLFSFGVSSIHFNQKFTEIRGSHCKGDAGILNTAVWIIFAGAIPTVLTILFSILTCLKVKMNVSTQTGSTVKSVIILNTVSLIAYLVLRAGAILVYFIVVSIHPTTNATYLWTLLARYIGELNYPLTLCSILILHSSIRRMMLVCCKNSFSRFSLTARHCSPQPPTCDFIDSFPLSSVTGTSPYQDVH